MRIPYVWLVFFISFYFILKTEEKQSQFSKISGYCGRGQKPHSNHTAAKKEYMKMQTLVVGMGGMGGWGVGDGGMGGGGWGDGGMGGWVGDGGVGG